jgi:hypothetical protein
VTDEQLRQIIGFNAERINESFFAGTPMKVNFVFSLGYGNASKLHPRGPRLLFEESCKIV